MTVALIYEEEHEVLREEARRFLAEQCPVSLVQEIGQKGGGAAERAKASSELFGSLAELGWLGLVLPEEYGGAGLGATHLAVVLEEAGRALLPAPLLPTTLAGLAILHGGSAEQRAALLPGIADGSRRATLAFVEPDGAWSFGATRATRAGLRLSGEKHHAWDAEAADTLLVPFVESDGTCRVAVVDAGAAGVEIAPEAVLDETRPSARVRLSGVEVPDERVLALEGGALFDALLPNACTALAAEQVGGADALLAMTAEYAATREQFGVAIGAFQAVKHPLVNVLMAVEQGRSLVYAAASALDADPPAPEHEPTELARMAKAHVSDAYVFAASRAVQLHGGYGFTIDCPAHLYFKRAQTSRAAWGDAAHHRRAIAEGLCA